VDEFLSEKEQLEQIRDWWRENGAYLVGGVALGVILLLGWNRYNAYQQSQAESAAGLYHELRQAVADDAPGEALALLETLRSDYAASPYTDQGGLLAALMHLSDQQFRRAAEQLRYVLDNTGDGELAMIARLRLARVLGEQGRYEDALALLDVNAAGFAGRFNEVRGDLHRALGDLESARLAYAQALNSEQMDLVDRNLVQMKLDDLPSLVVPAPPPVRGAAPEENGA